MTPELRAFLFDPVRLRAMAEELAHPGEPPLNVTRHDSERTFLVRSERSRHTHYLVDLDDPVYPKGRCTCDDYGYRKEGKVRRKERIRNAVCKHVRAVRAEIAHARMLCDDAGLPFSVRIIPTIAEYDHPELPFNNSNNSK